MNASPKTIVVGMSGGVDSSVAALLLHRSGYQVIGLFMKNWDEKGADGVCPAQRDFEDVARVCDRIGIPYYSVDFVKEYRERVFEKMLKAYAAGMTPNPDIACNREIKFDAFFLKARSLGAEKVATGHYCRIDRSQGHARLFKGMDSSKDQSYFLCQVPGEILEDTLFPIGDIPKSEVRRIAKEAGLPTASKKDSMGICFIGKRDMQEFLAPYVKKRPGEFRSLNGDVLGEHKGAHFYTIGQRKGMRLGGSGEPYFVVNKDHERNIVYVERGFSHPALFRDSLDAESVRWVSGHAPVFPFRCAAKIRYRQADEPCSVAIRDDGALSVRFDRPQRAVTPGQAVVFYDGDACLGGAWIKL